jgi:hypothetical protein
MTVPAQVQASSDRAKELMKTLSEQVGGPAPTPSAPATTTSVEAPKPVDTVEVWEQRYKSLQGMYNAEVPGLKNQVKELTAKISSLEGVIADVSKAPAPVAPVKTVTDKDREDYGDSIEVMRRVFAEEVSGYVGTIQELKTQLNSLQTNVLPKVATVEHRQQQSLDQVFWSELKAQVPNWQEINNDPQFHTWLLQPEGLSGIQRQSFLEEAQRKMDASRVAEFFTEWQRTSGKSPAQQTTQRSELEQQIAPGTSRSTTPPSNEGKKWTRDEVSKFFNDVAKGLYKGREQERNATERDIFAAQKDGRIAS